MSIRSETVTFRIESPVPEFINALGQLLQDENGVYQWTIPRTESDPAASIVFSELAKLHIGGNWPESVSVLSQLET